MINLEIEFHKVTSLPDLKAPATRNFIGHVFFNDATTEPETSEYFLGIYLLTKDRTTGALKWLQYNGLPNTENLGMEFDKLKSEITMWAKKAVDKEISKAELALNPNEIKMQVEKELKNELGALSQQITSLKVKSDSIESVVAKYSEEGSKWAQLKQTADSVSSTIKNSADQISSLIQTAENLTLKISDVDGNYSEIQQTVEAISIEVKNAQEALSKIEITAESVETLVKDAQEEYSKITQYAGSIESLISSMNGSYTQLQQTAIRVETLVTNAEGEISSIKQTADEIRQEVSDAENDIAQLVISAEGIEQKVTSAQEDIDGKITEWSSKIEQTADQIKQEVSNGLTSAEIIARINNGESEVKINADKIKLDGQTIVDSLKVGETGENPTDALKNLLGYDTKIADLQNQVDGVIDNIYYDGYPVSGIGDDKPVETAYPYSTWLDPDTRNRHIGDTFTNTKFTEEGEMDGRSWKFIQDSQSGEYRWSLLDDFTSKALKKANEAIEAANAATEAANNASDAANNAASEATKKQQVFVNDQPVPPYNKGDLWIKTTNEPDKVDEIFVCNDSKSTGEYNASDWNQVSTYLGDDILNSKIETEVSSKLTDINNAISNIPTKELLKEGGYVDEDGNVIPVEAAVENIVTADGTGKITIGKCTWYTSEASDENGKKYVTIGTGIGSASGENLKYFIVEKDGLLTARNAVIYGTIHAGAGDIGGIKIKQNSIESDNGNFSVTKDGTLSATNANISGEINATKLTIGGKEITDENSLQEVIRDLQSPNQNVTTTIDNSTHTTEYVENSYSDDWLRNSLSSDTTIQGGLVLSKVLSVNSDDTNLTAGMSGIIGENGLKDKSNSDIAFWAGNSEGGANKIQNSNFIVTHDGTVTANKGSFGSINISGENMVVGAKATENANSYFDKDGVLHCNGAKIKGEITATKLTIANDKNSSSAGTMDIEDVNGLAQFVKDHQDKTSGENYDDTWISSALKGDTTIEGGLILTTALGVGPTQESEDKYYAKAGIKGDDENIAFWAGAESDDLSTAKFKVTQDGKLSAQGAEISGKVASTSEGYTSSIESGEIVISNDAGPCATFSGRNLDSTVLDFIPQATITKYNTITIQPFNNNASMQVLNTVASLNTANKMPKGTNTNVRGYLNIRNTAKDILEYNYTKWKADRLKIWKAIIDYSRGNDMTKFWLNEDFRSYNYNEDTHAGVSSGNNIEFYRNKLNDSSTITSLEYSSIGNEICDLYYKYGRAYTERTINSKYKGQVLAPLSSNEKCDITRSGNNSCTYSLNITSGDTNASYTNTNRVTGIENITNSSKYYTVVEKHLSHEEIISNDIVEFDGLNVPLKSDKDAVIGNINYRIKSCLKFNGSITLPSYYDAIVYVKKLSDNTHIYPSYYKDENHWVKSDLIDPETDSISNYMRCFIFDMGMMGGYNLGATNWPAVIISEDDLEYLFVEGVISGISYEDGDIYNSHTEFTVPSNDKYNNHLRLSNSINNGCIQEYHGNGFFIANTSDNIIYAAIEGVTDDETDETKYSAILRAENPNGGIYLDSDGLKIKIGPTLWKKVTWDENGYLKLTDIPTT